LDAGSSFRLPDIRGNGKQGGFYIRAGGEMTGRFPLIQNMIFCDAEIYLRPKRQKIIFVLKGTK
jgi:hypothetical protein